MCNDIQWLWQQADWPDLHWQQEIIDPVIRRLHYQAGSLMGHAAQLNTKNQQTLKHQLLISAVDPDTNSQRVSLSNSLGNQLGIAVAEDAPHSAYSDKLAINLINCCTDTEHDLTLERLLEWHQALKPDTKSELRKPGDAQLPPQTFFELLNLIEWFNSSHQKQSTDPLIRAAISYLRTIAIQPFNQSNDDIARFISSLALNQAYPDKPLMLFLTSDCFGKSETNKQLQISLKSSTDITHWLFCFFNIIEKYLDKILTLVLQNQQQTAFWLRMAESGLTAAQSAILKQMLDQHQGSNTISASEYQQISGLSKASATRHLSELLQKGCIEKLSSGGRSTRYKVNITGRT